MNDSQIKKERIKLIINPIIAISIFLICDLFFKIVTWQEYVIIDYAFKFIAFFSLVIYTLFWAISKHTWKATLISYTIVFIISIVNQIKLVFTSEPIYFSDIKFLRNIGDLTSLVTGNISLTFAIQFILIMLVFAGILATIIFICYKNNFEMKNKKARIAVIIVDLILLICIFIPNKYTKEFYLKMFFNTEEYVDFNSHTTNLGFYTRNGLINGMYGIYLNNIFVEPDGYNEELLNNMLENSNTKIEKSGKPNIIVVFAEAFWDIEQLEEIEFDTEITSNFNKLKEKGKLVNTISPAYGGMSENVTFEVVTGGSLNYFSKGYIPVMSLYSRKNSEEIPSLVKTLKENGYNTQITFGKDYYISKDTYLKIGFDNYSELAQNKDFVMKDRYCVNSLINSFENKSDKPFLHVLATIEGHMPFAKDKYDNYDIKITKSNLTEKMNDTVLSYAQGIYNTDKELGRLYEFIESYDEPTILIVLGDHLPYMYTESGKNVIDELNYFNTDNELINNYRLYNPQALILSNYENNISIPDYIGTDQILNCIVNQLDVEVEPYYKWLYNTIDILPGINRDIAFDKTGNLYSPNELPEEMKTVYDNRKLMQYKFFINN